ncbi:MAG TPA: sugar phosphate isomerase/epimerase family protein [Planctomycetota bacterium]|nr:sugar phosphate isomerase/epimerase family protein [Planctomycetota bacterium]
MTEWLYYGKEVAMQFGFCANYDEKLFRFAAEAGFDGVELFVPNTLVPDASGLNRQNIAQQKAALEAAGIRALTVFHFANYADANAAKARAAVSSMKKAMDLAEALGTKIVTCNAWVPAGVPFAEQLKFYTKVFGRFAKMFEDRGMQLAIENCPHGGRNIGYSPWTWERMFDAVPSKAIGLEFDPSHLVFQFIDVERALYAFADRVYAFHAKDTQIYPHVLERTGVLGKGWWKFRIPGYGDVDWTAIFRGLTEIGFDGNMIIEHEDPIFHGGRREEGLRLGLKHLKSFVV